MRDGPHHSPHRDTYHHGDLAKALKAEAALLISEIGVANFSIRDLAAKLDVAPSAVYRHFSDKAALLTAVSLDAFQRLGQNWLDLMALREAATEPVPALIAIARFSAGADAYFKFANDNRGLFQLMYSSYGTGTFGLAKLSVLGSVSPYAILSGVLDDMLESGVIGAASRPNAEVQAFAAIHGISCLCVSGAFEGLDQAGVEAQLELVKDNIFIGLVAGPKENLS